MSQSANVRSVQAISDFKVALDELLGRRPERAQFRGDGGPPNARLAPARPAFPLANPDQAPDRALAIARSELHRRQLSQQGSDAVSDTEQKEDVRIAQAGSKRPSTRSP